jgi:hypothetical protein
MEYHGWEHPDMCASKTDTVTCWYNVDTFHLSEDDGHHFASPKPPGERPRSSVRAQMLHQFLRIGRQRAQAADANR